jgi:hypothetical protein
LRWSDQDIEDAVHDTTTIDTPAGPSTEPTTSAPPGPETTAQPDAQRAVEDASTNAWERATKALRESSEAAAETRVSDATPDGEATADAGDATDARKPDENSDDQRDESQSDDPSKPKATDRSKSGARRYEVVGTDGKPAGDVEWEDGTVVRMKIDGRVVEAKSFDDLVQLAQKGALADRHERRLSVQANQISQLERRVRDTESTAEQTLLAALFGTDKESAEDVQERLREALEPFRNPEFREGQEAKRREAERAARERESQAEQVQQLNESVWTVAREQFGDALTEFPYLDTSDADTVLQGVYQRYATQFASLAKSYEANAKAHGIPVEQAHALAQHDALKVLSEDTLRAVMKELDDRYAARAAKKRGASGADRRPPSAKPAAEQGREAPEAETADELDDDDRDLEAEAAAHNERVKLKLEQRARTRTLRGSGAAPNSEPAPVNTDGMSWNERMAAMKRTLRGAR